MEAMHSTETFLAKPPKSDDITALANTIDRLCAISFPLKKCVSLYTPLFPNRLEVLSAKCVLFSFNLNNNMKQPAKQLSD
jgi:hypothetical protein